MLVLSFDENGIFVYFTFLGKRADWGLDLMIRIVSGFAAK
jgi:hypothetical protein